MGYAELYLSRASLLFGGVDADPASARVVVLGVPYDATSSYRAGSREAPRAIREAAANIEFFSPRVGLDIEKVSIHDAGDVVALVDPVSMVDVVSKVVAELYSPEQLLVVLGGEHTITYGVLRGLLEAGQSPCLLVFDAHLDMRDEYMGHRFSHACVTRRIVEDLLNPNRVTVVGSRAYVAEEEEFAQRHGIVHVDVLSLRRRGYNVAANAISQLLHSGCTHLHISVDMDGFDPSYAPGVANPEPEGLTVSEVLDMLHDTIRWATERGITTSLDVVEVSPPYDPSGVTSILAAKVVVEYIAASEAHSHPRARM